MKHAFICILMMLPTSIFAQSSITDDDFHLNTVLFERNADLTLQSKQQLDLLSNVMAAGFLTDTCYLFSGHSDASGPEDINQTVSEARAIAAKDYILSATNQPNLRIETIGFGETKLLANEPATSRYNRRVVIMAQNCS